MNCMLYVIAVSRILTICKAEDFWHQWTPPTAGKSVSISKKACVEDSDAKGAIPGDRQMVNFSYLKEDVQH